jgi:hypothetical protein
MIRSLSLLRHTTASLVMLAIATVALGFGYPLLVTGISQLFFHSQANGSPVYSHGKLAGSALLGQSFSDAKGNPLPRYFQPRPSDAGNGYDGADSSASNLGPSSPLLIGFIAGVNTVGLGGKPSAINPFATAADPACVPLDPSGDPVTSPTAGRSTPRRAPAATSATLPPFPNEHWPIGHSMTCRRARRSRSTR